MTIEQMAPRDAQMYWMSTKIPNDQFLLFCFDSPTADLDTVRSVTAARAARIADLRVRAVDVAGHLDYPYWAPRDESQLPLTVHTLADASWPQCRSAVAALLSSTVDIRESPWHLHLFPGVKGRRRFPVRHLSRCCRCRTPWPTGSAPPLPRAHCSETGRR